MGVSRILLGTLLVARHATAQIVALTHVNVVDLGQGRIERDQTILIDGGRIAAGGTTGGVRGPSGASQYDYRDGYVVPGLWEMHAHLNSTGRSSFALYLANGVTGIRDMGGDLAHTRAWRDSIARGEILGPRLVVAGPIVERANWLAAVKGMAQ